jgi:hypothetical protein
VVRGPDALRAFLTAQLPAFQSAAGVLHFVYSVLLTRGLDRIRAGMFRHDRSLFGSRDIISLSLSLLCVSVSVTVSVCVVHADTSLL